MVTLPGIFLSTSPHKRMHAHGQATYHQVVGLSWKPHEALCVGRVVIPPVSNWSNCHAGTIQTCTAKSQRIQQRDMWPCRAKKITKKRASLTKIINHLNPSSCSNPGENDYSEQRIAWLSTYQYQRLQASMPCNLHRTIPRSRASWHQPSSAPQHTEQQQASHSAQQQETKKQIALT